MQVLSSESIILKQQDFRERDLLVTFLARDKGILKGVARGVRRITGRGVGSYELFSRCHIFYTESSKSELVSIRKSDLIPPHMFLELSYEKYLYAGYMSELVHLCPVRAPEAEGFFLLLTGGLARLSECDSPQALFLPRLDFELDFLACLGVQPGWSNCCQCGRPLVEHQEGRVVPLTEGMLQFDANQGGLRCPNCRTEIRTGPDLSQAALAFLVAWRGPARDQAPTPTPTILRELSRAVGNHLLHHLERKPRSRALLPEP